MLAAAAINVHHGEPFSGRNAARTKQRQHGGNDVTEKVSAGASHCVSPTKCPWVWYTVL